MFTRAYFPRRWTAACSQDSNCWSVSAAWHACCRTYHAMLACTNRPLPTVAWEPVPGRQMPGWRAGLAGNSGPCLSDDQVLVLIVDDVFQLRPRSRAVLMRWSQDRNVRRSSLKSLTCRTVSPPLPREGHSSRAAGKHLPLASPPPRSARHTSDLQKQRASSRPHFNSQAKLHAT